MRLDRYLVERGLVESREKAKRLIQEGKVRVEGKVVQKPAHPVPEGARVELLAEERYVGRGAYKLLGALEAFPVEPRGKVAADLGASTGMNGPGALETLLRGTVETFAERTFRSYRHLRAAEVGRA